jgi:hypothetical protein
MESPATYTAPCETPVALFVYHRPDLTRRVLETVRAARPTQLLVVADGPSPQQPDDARLCRETQDVLGGVDWPCRLRTHFSTSNLGVPQRLATGLDWVFSQVPEAIVLEDDCIPDATFFRFCSELLTRYRDEQRVYMVRGSNFLAGRRLEPSSYYFSRFFNIWGWATWARAWRHFDVNMKRWPECRDSGWLERVLPQRMVPQMRNIFDETHAGRLPEWSFPWQFAGLLHNAVAATPSTNLVTNAGFGTGASYFRDPHHHYARLRTGSMQFPLSHPAPIRVHEEADSHEWDFAFPDPGALKNLPLRLIRRLRRVFGRAPA